MEKIQPQKICISHSLVINMSRFAQGVLLVLLLFGRSSVYAMDGDFYTHESFSQVVNAFKHFTTT